MSAHPLQPLPIMTLPAVSVSVLPSYPVPAVARVASVPIVNRGWGANYRRPDPINGTEQGKIQRAAQILMNIKKSKTYRRRSSRKTKKNTRRR